MADITRKTVDEWVEMIARLHDTSEPHQGSAYRDPVRLGGSQDQTVDRDRDQPGRHAGFALQPHGPVWSRDHVAGKGLDGMMLGLVASS
ncbi:hypothetical protein [Micromonospora sp. IBHARD004]|uniref:hypothetical protein n=1 Tax=Micromonospora sp. IBHARD004 TaxID=3457764 RepID=UPI004057F1FE